GFSRKWKRRRTVEGNSGSLSHERLTGLSIAKPRPIMSSAERLIEVFHEAKARAPGAERERFLAEACAEEADLKHQDLSLLRGHEKAGGFLSGVQLRPEAAAITEEPGDRIGRYKLLERIGEGGGGAVYVADQEEPVQRRVALKIIKLGMDTRQVVARFE